MKAITRILKNAHEHGDGFLWNFLTVKDVRILGEHGHMFNKFPFSETLESASECMDTLRRIAGCDRFMTHEEAEKWMLKNACKRSVVFTRVPAKKVVTKRIVTEVTYVVDK